MCVTATLAVVAVVAAATSAYATVQTNNARAMSEQFALDMQGKQLREEAEMRYVAQLEEENERAREFNRSWSSNLAAIGATGVLDHISFFQGIGPESEARFLDDVRASRLNMTQDVSRIRDQIGVVGFNRTISAFNRRMGNLSAGAKFAQDAANAYGFYRNYSGG